MPPKKITSHTAAQSSALGTLRILERITSSLEDGKIPPVLLIRRLRQGVDELKRRHVEIEQERTELVIKKGLSPSDADKKVLQKRQRAFSTALGYTPSGGKPPKDILRDYQIAEAIHKIREQQKCTVEKAIETYLSGTAAKENGYLSENHLRNLYYQYLQILNL